MMSNAEYVGKATLNASKPLQDTFSLAFNIISKCLDKKTYNSASRKVLINQIYFTAIQILPLFLSVSAVIGFLLTGIVLHTLKELGLAEYLGRIIMGFVVTELAPFITVLLLALRSSSAMNAEIATMKVYKELHTLVSLNIDSSINVFIPSALAGVISVV